MVGGQCTSEPPDPDACASEARVDSVWLSEVDVAAAEQAHPLLGVFLRSGGNSQRHRLFIDPHLEGLVTGPEGRQALFRFEGETARSGDNIRFSFELDGHPDVASLEGELTPSSEAGEPQGFVRVVPVASSDQEPVRTESIEW
jgi:hypothetical protein